MQLRQAVVASIFLLGVRGSAWYVFLRSSDNVVLCLSCRPVPYDVTSDTMPNLELSLVPVYMLMYSIISRFHSKHGVLRRPPRNHSRKSQR